MSLTGEDYPLRMRFNKLSGPFELSVSWKYKAPSKKYCDKCLIVKNG